MKGSSVYITAQELEALHDATSYLSAILLFPRGSRSYVAWAAGVDNAQDDRKAAVTTKTGGTQEMQK